MTGMVAIWKKGERVQVTVQIRLGMGETPKPGAAGRVERQLEDGTVLVMLDDGQRVLLASWEVEALVS
jgi:hypothetical protein